MEKCQKCSMPMKEDQKCSCELNVCYHCCECPDNCKCGCKGKEKE